MSEMNSVIKRDYTLGGNFAFDENKKQEVIIFYAWDNVFRDGIYTYVKVFGRMDGKTYSTDLRNISKIRAK